VKVFDKMAQQSWGTKKEEGVLCCWELDVLRMLWDGGVGVFKKA
jgi:hypothetical protein